MSARMAYTLAVIILLGAIAALPGLILYKLHQNYLAREEHRAKVLEIHAHMLARAQAATSQHAQENH